MSDRRSSARRSTRARGSRARSRPCSRSTRPSTRSTTSSRSTSGRTIPRRTACCASSSTSTASTSPGIAAVIGYLHTGFEKTMEQKTWWKCITYPERIDYVSFQVNELAFVLAIEKLLAIEVPQKATWMRMCMAELTRIHSHLVWLGTSALELGAISMFWYTFDDRDATLDLFEMVAGTRMHTRYFQAGGLAEDIPEGFYAQAREWCKKMPKAIDEYEAILDRNAIWLKRTKGIGLLSADDAIALGQSGPGAPRLRRRLGPAQEHAVPRLRRGLVRRAGLPGGRRLRALQGAHGRDARVGAHRLAVPRPPRRDARRAVDRRRPQGRAAAARGAAHLDGVADPPLQDRHRGLHGPRGRGLRLRRVAARASSASTSSRTAARSPGASSSARRASWRCRRRRPA